jgi:hypothetical protein
LIWAQRALPVWRHTRQAQTNSHLLRPIILLCETSPVILHLQIGVLA